MGPYVSSKYHILLEIDRTSINLVSFKYLYEMVVKHRKIKNEKTQMASHIKAQVVKTESRNRTTLPNSKYLRIIKSSPEKKVPPSEKHSKVPKKYMVDNLEKYKWKIREHPKLYLLILFFFQKFLQ